MEIKKGTNIVAKHINSSREINYKVVVERLDKDYFRLLNVDSSMVMSGFKSIHTEGVIDYIENVLECEIIEYI